MKISWEFPYLSQRMPIFAQNVVATSQPLAAQAGLQMLVKGGNAVDAALATAIALTVVEPTSNGIGGDAFAMVWQGLVEDDEFNLDYHVRRVALPQPHDHKALCEFMSAVYAYQLDRSRPLWKCWVVEGLEGGKVAFVTMLHHAYVVFDTTSSPGSPFACFASNAIALTLAP